MPNCTTYISCIFYYCPQEHYVYKRIFIFLFRLKKPTNLDKLIDVVKDGDTVIVSSVDRISRNVDEVYKATEKIILKCAKLNILDLGTFDNINDWQNATRTLIRQCDAARDRK